ncbi:membrane protein [Erwinia phage vB_EamM_Y3]|uniref:Putative membrane protein n=1 Tax=Erwinia phage vB_EamM_Y3 TaxID=1983553 RepID=A0A2H4IB57_9CAUD|nr:membrane protein [Erwinia phage vB_EamM_Y3]ARW58740.1 putative membrane protein [Erwinia phage vB_EamM_Y3]QZE55962.1 hypothetical protein pEaSNUABM52_00104 [Erwinia phage pEp_SNUABM_52]
MWTDILGQLLASEYATALSVIALILGGGFYWLKVIPMMEELEQAKARLAEIDEDPTGQYDSVTVSAELEEIKKAVQAFSESAPVDNLDMKEGLNSVLRAIQRFERIISQQSRDHQSSSDLMREVLDGISDLRQELGSLSLRLHSLSSSLYTSPNAPGGSGVNDLRALR